MAACLYTATSLHINNSILNYLAPDSPVQQRVAHLKTRLAGLYTLQLVVHGHVDGVYERVQYLGELEKIQAFITRHPYLDHSMSFADYISMLNSAVNDTGEPELPLEDDVVETLMLFVGPDDVAEYLSEDHSRASIVVRHSIAESARLSEVIDHTMHFMVRYNQHFGGGNDRITAVSRTIRDEANPIGTATIALAAGFGTLALSGFPPIYYFGLLSAMTMLFAFLATFVLAPILLSYVPRITLWDMLATSVRRELRGQCPLFRGMRTLRIRRVILLGQVSVFKKGATIMQRGELGDAIFILLRGKVAVEAVKTDGNADRVKIASTGEVFGLAALMCGKPRVATATALEEAEVLALDWERLQRIARFFPRSAYFLFRNLSAIIGERLAGQVEQPIETADTLQLPLEEQLQAARIDPGAR